MALEIEGTLRQKLTPQRGTSARGEWTKQEFVLEFPDGNYTSQACFTAFGQDKVAELDKYQVGDKVKVSFNLRSREFNGRWYNDLQIWKVAPAAAAQGAPVQSTPVQSAPAGGYAPAPQAASVPAPTIDDMPAEDDSQDDLPF
ncbi:MAG: DUF3127 domain-containing protein [Bacteroidales bacterium]|nr:DUF3127 domain-containing protein [Bacteroidales bacterium]